MEENRVKSFHDITARRWNDIINAVNSRRPADSIEPPLEEHELAELGKMEAERDGGVPDGVTETSFRAFWSEADEYDMRLPGAVRNGCRIVNLPPSVKTIRLDSFGENTKIVNIASSTNVIGCVEDNTKIKINRY